MNVHHAFIAGGSVLVLVQGVKLIGTVSNIRWIFRRGPDFIAEINAHENDFTESAYWTALDRSGGRNVLPLGVLEYPLIRAASRRGPAVKAMVRFIRHGIYDFTALGLYIALFLFLAGTPILDPPPAVATLAWASATLAVLQLLAFYGEACVSYARIGSYGLGFHGAGRYFENRASGTYLAEVKTLVGAAIYSLFISTLILYFAVGQGARFGALTVTRETVPGILSDLLTCLYYSVAVFFTADTPEPENGMARLAVGIIILQAACALILAVTSASIHIAPEPPTAEPAPAEEAEPVPVNRPGNHLLTGFLLGAAVVGAAALMRRRNRGD